MSIVDDIDIVQPDTAVVPNSGPTVASRTCMVVGKLVESAARSIRRTLAETGLPAEGYTRDDFLRACRVHVEQQGTLRASAQYRAPHDVKWDDEKYEGDAYGSYAWAAYVAEVSVDTVTFEVRVDDFVAVQEVGKVINPVLASGQIEGGVAQAIGWALYEDVVWREGRMANAQMTNYIMPTVRRSSAHPRATSRRCRIHTARPARRGSESCRWTVPRRRLPMRSPMPPVRTSGASP